MKDQEEKRKVTRRWICLECGKVELSDYVPPNWFVRGPATAERYYCSKSCAKKGEKK